MGVNSAFVIEIDDLGGGDRRAESGRYQDESRLRGSERNLNQVLNLGVKRNILLRL
jgi:hypothetical protein